MIRLVDLADGHFEISWPTGVKVAVYLSTDDAVSFTLLEESETGVLNFAPQSHYTRHIFKVVSNEASVLLTQRRFHLEGGPNFRDFGGYASEFGGYLPWGRLYRSGRLADFSENDLEFINKQNIQTAYDLRQLIEVDHAPSTAAAESGVRLVEVPISPGGKSGFLKQIKHTPLTREQAELAMIEAFEDFAENQGEHLARVVNAVLESDSPLIVHCSAGKDRTGVTAALILRVLGVSFDDIYADYMLTKQYYPPANEREHIAAGMGFKFGSADAAEPLMTVDDKNLKAFFAFIIDRYGSETAYFEQVLGIDTAKRQHYAKQWLLS